MLEPTLDPPSQMDPSREGPSGLGDLGDLSGLGVWNMNDLLSCKDEILREIADDCHNADSIGEAMECSDEPDLPWGIFLPITETRTPQCGEKPRHGF